MFTLTVDEARNARICRVCGRPINHPPTAGLVDECLEHRPQADVVQRDGREYAHAACLAPVLVFNA